MTQPLTKMMLHQTQHLYMTFPNTFGVKEKYIGYGFNKGKFQK